MNFLGCKTPDTPASLPRAPLPEVTSRHVFARAKDRRDCEEGGSRRRHDLLETRGTDPILRRVDGSSRWVKETGLGERASGRADTGGAPGIIPPVWSRLDARLIRLAVAVLLRGTSEHGSIHTPRRNPGGKIGSRKMMTLNLQSLLFAVTCAAGIVAGAAETASSFALVDISATISSNFKFDGAAAAGDGRVVFAPLDANGVGVFGSTAPSCIASTYPKLTSPDNAAAGTCAGLTELASGETCVPECNSGYSLSGQVTTSCSAGTLTLATCVAPPCTCCESRMMEFGFSVGRVCAPL